MNILAIETSCDETAAAVVQDGWNVLSSIVATQIEQHQRFGGVVPEIASRCHIKNISTVIEAALFDAGMGFADIDAIAVTYSPGLIGALLVGVGYAKGLSYALNKPLIPVHHLRGHVAGTELSNSDLKPPYLCLIMSGGHTQLVEVLSHTDFRLLGSTRDDAVGEVYDKVARAMNLGYPGGPVIDTLATEGNACTYTLPRPKTPEKLGFSFSGLKTAVVNLLHNASQKEEQVHIPDLAASFQLAVCDILSDRAMAALAVSGHDKLTLAGGVAANTAIRKRLQADCERRGCKLYWPEPRYCGDNAAMIGAQAYHEYQAGHIALASLNAYATMSIDQCNM